MSCQMTTQCPECDIELSVFAESQGDTPEPINKDAKKEKKPGKQLVCFAC